MALPENIEKPPALTPEALQATSMTELHNMVDSTMSKLVDLNKYLNLALYNLHLVKQEMERKRRLERREAIRQWENVMQIGQQVPPANFDGG
jgi:hypothetical protein